MKFLILGLFLKAALLSSIVIAIECPCSDPLLCDPIVSTPKKETFVFSVTDKNWMKYDWTKITTIGARYTNASLVCYAHSRGVRVVKLVDFKGDLTNATDRHSWVLEQIKIVEENFLDGLNVDYEKAIGKGQPKLRDGLTALVKELATALRSLYKNSQITFDAPYLPGGGRHFDFRGLADVVDFLFIMAYDESYGCVLAWANCPLSLTTNGLKQFIQSGIPAEKLVLGIPWYGYNYKCLKYTKENKCYTAKVPFRGAACSDAPGSQMPYSVIKGSLQNTSFNSLPYSTIKGVLLNTSFTGRLWDSVAQSPYFSYKHNDTASVYQVWYDDVKSLRIKYKLAERMNLRGVGMWQADAIDYKDTQEGRQERADMWGALPDRK